MTTHPTSDSLLDTIKQTVLVSPHPAGWPFIGGGALATLLFFLIDDFVGTLFLVLTLFIVYFFRDPKRAVPQRDGLVVSPADGRVINVKTGVALPPEIAEISGEANYTKISIFLSVFDVHVNRIPVAGQIIKTAYVPGKFVNAALDKASEDNERAALLIETDDGKKLGVMQIAGLVARRIVTDVKENDHVETGVRYGIIRFGSRADIYLPAGTHALVCVGQRCVGGETILADLNSDEPARDANII